MGETSFIITLILFNIIFVAFLIGIVVFIYQYKSKRKQHLQQINILDQNHKKELLETQIEIQTNTMEYIGREIHDNVGQKLTLASLYIQQYLIENKLINTNTTINSTNEMINEALDELRQLSKSLTNDYIKNTCISQLIQEECTRINSLQICNVTVYIDPTVHLDSYIHKSVVYRITQEFLQNSIKHSSCKNISIVLIKQREHLTLSIKDDGIGFDIGKLKNNGIGTYNIKKRAQLVNGLIKLDSQKDKGTELILEFSI